MIQKTNFQTIEIGSISADWKFDKLENHLIIKGRIGWKGLKKEEYLEKGYAIINGSQIVSETIDWKNCGRITKERYDESPEIKLQVDDILITKDGTIGKLAYIKKLPEPTTVASGIFVIRNNSEILDQKFLYFYFKSPFFSHLIESRREGSVVPHLYQKDITQFIIPLPPLNEQHAIARILGSLDDKIELNRQMNETLEAMARAIFQSWFVDFDPVRAKAEGCDTGLPPDIAALFPDGFEVVDGREVPRGWGIALLPDVFEINPKRTLVKDQIAPYLDMQNVPTRGHRPIDWLMRAFGSGTKFVNGDTLLARITPCLENGKTIFVDFLDDRQVGWGSTEYIVLRPKQPLPPEFGYLLARDEDFRSHAILNMSGSSGRQRVPSECFDSYEIVVPSKEIAQCFGDVVKPLMARIKANDEQSHTLAQIRDALLPKLMSGEIQAGLES